MSKRFSPSCERNQQAILAQLSVYFKQSKNVLEIGSGTGQHAVYFASHLPQLNWHTSDMPENHASVNAWISDFYKENNKESNEGASVGNIAKPVAFTLGQDGWPNVDADAVFTANTTHIMQPDEAKLMMEMVAQNLPVGGVFCQYGPMLVDGNYTSASNQEFDASLKQQGFGGIQDIAQLIKWAKGMTLIEAIPMPANNFLLVWQK